MKKKLKSQSFMQGAFIATLGIVISKILGIVYVIPFYGIIGDKGGALYGYAYNVYAIFLGISQAGLPLAMSKMISEYNALGYKELKDRVYKLGLRTMVCLALICFTILMIFAKPLGMLIIGNVTGGNTVDDIAFVIRLISCALLVVPLLSVSRGYLQGHKIFTPSSISQVLEQIVRVLIIIFGSYLGMRVFNLSLTSTVGIAVFSAFPASLVSYLYLRRKIRKNKASLETTPIEGVKEPKISDKKLIKLIITFAIPFVMIDIFRSLYNSIDVVMLVKVLTNGLGYTTDMAEGVMGIISTWGNKINMIVIAVGSGVISSLIPNISASFVKNDHKDVNDKINKTLEILLFVCTPMVCGLSFLAKPVWTVFYGSSNTYGPIVYQYFVFVALSTVFFTCTITTVQMVKEYKKVFITLICGFMVNVICNIPFLYLFDYIGLPAYYGSITSTIFGYLVATFMSIRFLKKKHNINYEEFRGTIPRTLLSVFCMVITLFILKLVLPFNSISRLMNVVYIIIYMIVGIIVYGFVSIKSRIIYDVLGNSIFSKIKRKMRIN